MQGKFTFYHCDKLSEKTPSERKNPQSFSSFSTWPLDSTASESAHVTQKITFKNVTGQVTLPPDGKRDLKQGMPSKDVPSN